MQTEHRAQFYLNDGYLCEAAAQFLADGLRDGGSIVLITSTPRRDSIASHLLTHGFDLTPLGNSGKATVCDARELLAQFMAGGVPDRGRFTTALSSLLDRCAVAGDQPAHVYGDMVEVLCQDGNPSGAIQVEQLWNELAEARRFSVMCGFALASFPTAAHLAHFEEVCRHHTHVLPTERYVNVINDAHRLREITILQQRALALEAELEQRKALERALRQAIEDRDASSRLKDEFLAVVSHELRTPLNAILGWTQIATGQETDASTIRRALGIIQRNATAQLHVVNDLLDVSRIVAGQMPMSADSIDLGETIAAAIETVKPAALAKNVQIDFTIEPDSRLVVGDSARLQQVFWNLFANAIKFTPPRGRVDVRLGRDGLYALITVTDTGEGIDAEFLPHVFERFRQADGGSTRKHGGLGLGLAVVRYLVEAHGGSVAAQSAGESRGATFTVRLPAA